MSQNAEKQILFRGTFDRKWGTDTMAFKFAFVGQDIPMHLPFLLVDFLYAGKEEGILAVEEKNAAMQDVLRRYAQAIIYASGQKAQIIVSGNRQEVLMGADCVVYAGDCMAATRFRQDRDALSGVKDDDPGLTNQARVHGGIEGLMHTLRQGEMVLDLCRQMRNACPNALVVTLGQPVARTTQMFLSAGFQAYGMDTAAYHGNTRVALAKALYRKEENVESVAAGLPGFSFLMSIREKGKELDLMPAVRQLAQEGKLGRLTQRWLRWYDAVAVGDVVRHAEFLAEQEDYIPAENPEFGESIERRKERIARMNTIGQEGAKTTEGMTAQLLLLKDTPPTRPVQLALAILRKETCTIPAVAHRNQGDLAQLSPMAVVESDLHLEQGKPVPQRLTMPMPLVQIMSDIDETNRLSAQAARGDWTALREVVEIDPAMEGLDRLYVQEVVRRLVQLNGDVLSRLVDDEDE